ncbi:grpE protein homolog 1, mitochondrial [Cimex lectularius]|uniref:GrpE protein homolog n=1 Tax=Cimex lectularius TaxID=79782 RepID=A0A8I6TLA6_CIMLE|nr:grpE protein homolog 1, mitochondrial [Cimex lectularius]
MSLFPRCFKLCRVALETQNIAGINLRRVQGKKYAATATARQYSSNSVSDSKIKDEQTSSAEPEEKEAKADPQVEELNKLLEDMTKQKDELSDKYKRALAENENMRKRLMKQIEEAKMYGIQSFCKDLLEVSDVLSKATECVPKEEIKDTNPHLKNLYVGLTMTEAELMKVFKRHGLSPVNPIDEKFDPNLHEALFQQEVAGKAPGTVVVVSKIGYKLHDRVVRPALVGVAKG